MRSYKWKELLCTCYFPLLNFDALPQPARKLFRFEVDQLKHLCVALNLPDTFITRGRSRFSALEAMAIVARRLAYPCRLVDLSLLFGRTSSAICEIFLQMVHLLHDRFAPMMETIDWNRIHGRLQEYADSISLKCA
jgi:hypothetical protein